MAAKLICLAVTLVVVAAQDHGHDGHGHGHAFSSQSIVLHQSHEPAHHVELLHGNEEHHGHELQQHGHEVYHHGHEQVIHGYPGYEQLHQGLQVQHLGYEQLHHGQEVEHHGVEQIQHGHVELVQGHQEQHGHHEEQHIDYHAHPKYEFAYKVVDPHTHDEKSQQEHRDGDVVKGVYSLHQPDGVIRIVEYYADKKSGFNANVKYEGHAQHIVPEHQHHH